jgi:hypothetical protein
MAKKKAIATKQDVKDDVQINQHNELESLLDELKAVKEELLEEQNYFNTTPFFRKIKNHVKFFLDGIEIASRIYVMNIPEVRETIVIKFFRDEINEEIHSHLASVFKGKKIIQDKMIQTCIAQNEEYYECVYPFKVDSIFSTFPEKSYLYGDDENGDDLNEQNIVYHVNLIPYLY